jgi:hypothetical protein
MDDLLKDIKANDWWLEVDPVIKKKLWKILREGLIIG